MNFQIAFGMMVSSHALGLVAAMQLLVDPANTWIPWPVLVAILALAIVSTIKVVRFVDGVHREIQALREALTAHEKKSVARHEEDHHE